MNFHSDEWIKENLERHYQKVLTLFPKEQILAVFLQGSQNYGLDYEGSDVDTKAVIIPTLAEIASAQKPISTTHILPNGEHIDLKDIRLMIAAARAKAEVAIAQAEANKAKEYIEKKVNDFCTEETFKCDEQIEKLFKSVQEENYKDCFTKRTPTGGKKSWVN